MLELLSRHQPGKCLPMVWEEAKRRYPLGSGAGLGNGRNDCKRRKDLVGEKVPVVPGGMRMTIEEKQKISAVARTLILLLHECDDEEWVQEVVACVYDGEIRPELR